MKEIGGYIGFEHYYGAEYHKGCLALNSGRNCLRYLIRARHIKGIALPKYLCSAVYDVCREEGVKIYRYEIDRNFKPKLDNLMTATWLYIVNFYGQLSRDYLLKICENYSNVIIDNSQAFFEKVIPGVDTLYTCRKFFGVSDGAYLYTNCETDMRIGEESACDRMKFLLGRFERGADAFYYEYQKNEKYISEQEIKYMSCLSRNILKSVDYTEIKRTRNRNFLFLAEQLGDRNGLNITIPEGAYMYPFLAKNGRNLRQKLIERRIYVPILWPNVIEDYEEGDFSYDLADKILPLPCDQRYSIEDMKYIVQIINELI